MVALEKAEFMVNRTWARHVIVGGEVAGLLIKTLVNDGPNTAAEQKWMLTDVQPVLLDVYPPLWSSLAQAQAGIEAHLARAAG